MVNIKGNSQGINKQSLDQSILSALFESKPNFEYNDYKVDSHQAVMSEHENSFAQWTDHDDLSLNFEIAQDLGSK